MCICGPVCKCIQAKCNCTLANPASRFSVGSIYPLFYQFLSDSHFLTHMKQCSATLFERNVTFSPLRWKTETGTVLHRQINADRLVVKRSAMAFVLVSETGCSNSVLLHIRSKYTTVFVIVSQYEI